MARFSAVAESSAALASATAFANVVAAAAVGFKIRRIQLGVRTSTAVVPTSQQVTVGVNRATARGTASTTVAGIKLDPNSTASNITGVDTAWSIAPSLSAADMYHPTFNSQSGADLP